MDPIAIIVVSCMGIGLGVGLLAGMLGIGGGLIIVPALSYLMVHFLGIDTDTVMPLAIGTSLSTIIFTSISSARAHYRLGNLDPFIMLWCGLGIAVGSVGGALVATSISGHTLKNIFAVLVIAVAMHMLFGKRQPSAHSAGRYSLMAVGAGTGGVSALMGIGGGALLVPALVWLQVHVRQAIGCAAFSGLVVAVFGSASFIVSGHGEDNLPAHAIGYVYWPATLGIVVTSVFTANIGAKLGQKMNTNLLKRMLAGLLVLVSIRMIVGLE